MVTKATRDVLDVKIRPIIDGIDVNGDGSANFTIDGTNIGTTLAADGEFVNLTAQNLIITGTIDGSGAVLAGTWPATYSDLAECYESDHLYDPGTVVKLGGNKEITQTTHSAEWDVLGIISTNPAYLLNSGKDGTYLPVALIGRVPCLVVGPVRKGERLVSTAGGMARAVSGDNFRARQPNLPYIGRSLESNDEDDVKLVEVAVITIK